jgi:hypothetical protein
VQILRREAAIRTGTPLAIRVTSNVTLGPGLTAAVSIQRPVILIGMTSAVTSVDLGMEVNILNVTSPGAQLHWQGLVLENLAPGEQFKAGTPGGGGGLVQGKVLKLLASDTEVVFLCSCVRN